MADESGDDALALEIPNTAADQAAFLRYVTWRPAYLARHAGLFLVLGLFFVGFEIVLGLLGALFTAQHGLGEAAQRYLTSGIRRDLADSWPVTAGVVAGIFLLNLFILVPLQCRRIATRLLATYPETAETSPPTLVSQVRLDARGAENATRNERIFLAWPLLMRLAETSRYLYLMRSPSTALVLPKRALDGAQIERVRAICGRYIGAPASPAS